MFNRQTSYLCLTIIADIFYFNLISHYYFYSRVFLFIISIRTYTLINMNGCKHYALRWYKEKRIGFVLYEHNEEPTYSG